MSALRLNKANFKNTIRDSKGISVVDFYAEWCAPCKMMMPIVDEIAGERQDIIVGKVNVNEDSELATIYNVRSIPTLIVFKDGIEYTRAVGYKPKVDILSMLA